MWSFCNRLGTENKTFCFWSLDISEIGRSAKSYCEHTARTQPTLSDIVVTLVEMGEYISSFHFFSAAELGTWEREESPGDRPVCWMFLNLLVSLLVCFQLDSYQKRVPLNPCKRPLNSFGGLCCSFFWVAAVRSLNYFTAALLPLPYLVA